MADKSSFTTEEWSVIRDATVFSSLAVTLAGASGIVGTIKESFAAASALVEGMRSDNELVRSICSKDEIKGAQEALREKAAEFKGDDLKAIQAKISTLAVDTVAKAVGIVSAKSPADAAAYRDFLRNVGRKVAEAAKEGAFLQIGGERVSEEEKQMLARLEGALGRA